MPVRPPYQLAFQRLGNLLLGDRQQGDAEGVRQRNNEPVEGARKEYQSREENPFAGFELIQQKNQNKKTNCEKQKTLERVFSRDNKVLKCYK